MPRVRAIRGGQQGRESGHGLVEVFAESASVPSESLAPVFVSGTVTQDGGRDQQFYLGAGAVGGYPVAMDVSSSTYGQAEEFVTGHATQETRMGYSFLLLMVSVAFAIGISLNFFDAGAGRAIQACANPYCIRA